MLEFTGPSSALTFTSTVHVHADTYNCGANVNAHTHIMPAYVLSYQMHNSSLWTLPTVSAPFTVLSVPPPVPPSLIQRVQTESSEFVKYRKADLQYYQEYCVKMLSLPPFYSLFGVFGLDPALCRVGCDTPLYRITQS